MAAFAPPASDKADKDDKHSRVTGHELTLDGGDSADVSGLRPGRRCVSIGCEAHFYDGRL